MIHHDVEEDYPSLCARHRMYVRLLYIYIYIYTIDAANCQWADGTKSKNADLNLLNVQQLSNAAFLQSLSAAFQVGKSGMAATSLAAMSSPLMMPSEEVSFFPRFVTCYPHDVLVNPFLHTAFYTIQPFRNSAR